MPALPISSVLMTVEEYLEAEERSGAKHEYLAGMPYAMAGGTVAHQTIAANLILAAGGRLRGKPGAIFGSDMKLKLQLSGDTYFYYPDGMIVSGDLARKQTWCKKPSIIFEIRSDSTRLVDDREKRMAYFTLPSVDAYVRIEQDRREVVVDQRTPDGWQQEVLTDPAALLKLPSVDVEFPIAELYERLNFA